VGGVVETMRDIVGECLEVATRLGVSLPDDIVETVFGIAASMPNQLSSTAQDLARGKITEIDHLNGYVARKGRELGVPAPANEPLSPR
jgi:2-dehydropantoate 2-reductase